MPSIDKVHRKIEARRPPKASSSVEQPHQTPSLQPVLLPHMLVYRILESSQLDSGADSVTADHEEPGLFLMTSWQPVPLPATARLILSLLLDQDAREAGFLSPTARALDRSYDLDELGTFEVPLSSVVQNQIHDSEQEQAGNQLLPSFVMPRMMVASGAPSPPPIRVCVIGNGLDRLQKELGGRETGARYTFTNLNSRVDLVLLVFDAKNGLFLKDLFNILKSYRKAVLPIVDQTVSSADATIETGGYSDAGGSRFDINEGIVTSLLINNGLRLFARPVKVNARAPWTYEELHNVITSGLEQEEPSEYLEDEPEAVQNSTSSWASTILQNGSRRASLRRRVSESQSALIGRSRRKKVDKKRLLQSRISNSDPLDLSGRFPLGLGLGLAAVALAGAFLWLLRMRNRREILVPVSRPQRTQEIKEGFFRHPIRFMRRFWTRDVIKNENRGTFQEAIPDDVADRVVGAGKKVVFIARVAVCRAIMRVEEWLGSLLMVR